MRVGIVGFGKMGKLIRSEALKRGHTIAAVIDPICQESEVTANQVSSEQLSECEVVIDFTHPSVVVDHIILYAKLGIPAVIGTTGWYDRIPELQEIVAQAGGAIIYSGNYSLGVALFMQVVKEASRLFAKSGLYDPFLTEIHHAQKADSPSGTAEMLGSLVLENYQDKRIVEKETLHHKREDETIHLASVRGGWVPGTHTVYFDSPQDTIELTHRARSREGFAVGAVQAAAWITSGRKGFFSLDDMLEDVYLSVEKTQ
ncbi:4-hydroxy-tetrahydrodipicolinate reductase [Sphaerochaeta sp. S2]|uniref:4-hydroxy-tetrahydrodipicolinate reductase n=1 Tax=Sphaerochaeta sp. S2 TaxID=2798868 RepID=UPI0018EA1F5F|nr:4-hydroxy-tetrahydrodipicolinate reductase [Sphaerochaeta sp. S2]MBJ2356951.1 4-hydroxy-tetrahydrodipicolinate reductase [Sphaerochaeta sp. S2]